jgi:hypothetical protein
MLPDHSGRPMIAESISKVCFSINDVIVTILREHETKFHVTTGLKKVFGEGIQVVILEEKTKSQSETVLRTLEATGLRESFLVKDSDNCFSIKVPEEEFNYVCFDSLNNHSLINPRNKSYLQLDGQGSILNIKEKVVISDTFSVGGYYFTCPELFKETYAKLSKLSFNAGKELYLSDIITAMLLDNVPFKGKQVGDYQDWGTIHDWKRYLLSKKTYFIALDGYLFERGSEHFHPTYEHVTENAAAVKAVKQLAMAGHKIVLLSIRPNHLAELTLAQLRRCDLAELSVIYDCPISRWELVTAPYHGIPFRTCEAYELHPNSEDAFDQLTQ